MWSSACDSSTLVPSGWQLSPLSIPIVIIILFFAGSKHIKYVSLDYIIILSMIWITMMLMSTFFLGGSKLPYYPLYGLGVLMILISNIVMLFGFNRLNLETLTGNIP